jgi:hypothetical protein
MRFRSQRTPGFWPWLVCSCRHCEHRVPLPLLQGLSIHKEHQQLALRKKSVAKVRKSFRPRARMRGLRYAVTRSPDIPGLTACQLVTKAFAPFQPFFKRGTTRQKPDIAASVRLGHEGGEGPSGLQLRQSGRAVQDHGGQTSPRLGKRSCNRCRANPQDCGKHCGKLCYRAIQDL